MYQAVKEIVSKVGSVKKPKTYCKKGDNLFPITETEPIIVASKTDVFSVLRSEVKKVDMNPQKLIQAIRDVANNPHINTNTFPYDFVTGITSGKEWEPDFIGQLKSSDIEKTIKKNILERYENSN